MVERGIENIVTVQGHPTGNCAKKTWTNNTDNKKNKAFWSHFKIHPFSGGMKFLTNSTKNLLRHPELFISQRNFPSKDKLNLQASKNSPEEQIFWETDPLGAPDW